MQIYYSLVFTYSRILLFLGALSLAPSLGVDCFSTNDKITNKINILFLCRAFSQEQAPLFQTVWQQYNIFEVLLADSRVSSIRRMLTNLYVTQDLTQRKSRYLVADKCIIDDDIERTFKLCSY